MSVAILARPEGIRVYRAPLIDPPFDDELTPLTYRPRPADPQLDIPPEAIAGASPECHSAALRFLNVCLELFNGFRSPSQLRSLVHAAHLLTITDELTRTSRLLAEARRRQPSTSTPGRVRRVQLRTCEPRTGVIEVAAVLSDGVRTWAMCYRLERTQTWRCSYLRVIL